VVVGTHGCASEEVTCDVVE